MKERPIEKRLLDLDGELWEVAKLARLVALAAESAEPTQEDRGAMTHGTRLVADRAERLVAEVESIRFAAKFLA